MRTLYIETAPFIYLHEQHPLHFDKIIQVLQIVGREQTQVVTSVLTLTEVMTKPLTAGDMNTADKLRTIIRNNSHVAIIDEPIAIRAAQLRATYRFKTPDALHLATALESGCNAFLTNDADLKKAAGLRVLVLSELTLTPPQP